MSTNKEDILRQFCDVTGAEDDRSRFFLESSNWQLEVALSSFYEHGGNIDEAPAAHPALPVIDADDSDMESPPLSPTKPIKKEKKPRPTNQRFATLNTLQNESSSDEEEGQAFYAGGSDRSGQQIIGPGKSRNDVVSDMFKKVREQGAVVFDDEPTSTSRGGGTFSGVGYRLGQTADDHEAVSTGTQQRPANINRESTRDTQEATRAVRLRLYRAGFTVDSGPLREYTDPANAEFLNCIKRGEVPPEVASGGEVRVSLEDRRHEACPQPAAPARFAGKGHMLGSPTPSTVGAAPTLDVADRAANERAAQQAMNLDETLPVTNIQFRLADGTRVTGRFNHAHTVADLYRFVALAAPARAQNSFALRSGVRGADLTERTATIQEADLMNSLVLQRLV